jgi:dipeptidyl aminopeptidase/acylaminoacyl peptidase
MGPHVECPIRPFGGTDNFDIRSDAIILVSKDPNLNPALNTAVRVYIIYLESWTEEVQPRNVEEVTDAKYCGGAKTCPVFQKNVGRKAAFLGMETNGYESDRNRIYVIEDYRVKNKHGGISAEEIGICKGFEPVWDRSPGSLTFSADGRRLLVVAEEESYAKLFKVDLDQPQKCIPAALTSRGSVSDVQPLADGRTFISGSSLIDNSWFAIVAEGSAAEASDVWTHSLSGHGSKFGLKSIQVSSIWTPTSNPKVNKEVQSLVMRPSNYQQGKKYPVAYLIHGGPQGSWTDAWSTRWNPAVFAEQGYIVVAPNPTGSTGYGQKFTDAISKNYGQDPYQDIVNCFDWVGQNLEGADNDRAVALGASYGGYMINWIQGHPLGRKFKALVCHDGIFSMAGMLATEELYFPFHDLGSTPWYQPQADQGSRGPASETSYNFNSTTFSDWRKYDPSEHLEHWSTPQLVIHSSKDYRLPISEGLAAFNVLQARGVESQFLTFPDENHWVLKPENSLAWHKVVLNWVNKFVGFPVYADQDPEGEEFWGGVKKTGEEVGGGVIAGQGKEET